MRPCRCARFCALACLDYFSHGADFWGGQLRSVGPKPRFGKPHAPSARSRSSNSAELGCDHHSTEDWAACGIMRMVPRSSRRVTSSSSELDKGDSTWIVRRGLADNACVSIKISGGAVPNVVATTPL